MVCGCHEIITLLFNCDYSVNVIERRCQIGRQTCRHGETLSAIFRRYLTTILTSRAWNR